jgi:hypothetical protein
VRRESVTSSSARIRSSAALEIRCVIDRRTALIFSSFDANQRRRAM